LRASIAADEQTVKAHDCGISAGDGMLFGPAMPILSKEIELFPAGLFVLPASSFPWHVAHVRSRQEKVLARWLLEHEIPFYVPQIERLAERSARRFRSYVPLFGGYVFFRGAAEVSKKVLRSGAAVRIIGVDDQELLGAQLEQIRLLQLEGASFNVYEELLPNEIVSITDGPFRGYTGVVIRTGRRERLVVSLSLLRKNIAVEFDRPVLRRTRR
jgi:transcription antitermination factor NusG